MNVEEGYVLTLQSPVYGIKEESVCLLFAWKLDNIVIDTDMFRREQPR